MLLRVLVPLMMKYRSYQTKSSYGVVRKCVSSYSIISFRNLNDYFPAARHKKLKSVEALAQRVLAIYVFYSCSWLHGIT